MPEIAHMIVGVTPILKKPTDQWLPNSNARFHRQAECEMWIHANRDWNQPRIFIDDVEHWFDDDSVDLLLTNGLYGFTDGDALTLAMMINERL